MAIETNDYLKYDTDGHFYYLTTVGIEFYTGYDVSTEWVNPSSDIRAKKQGRQLKRWLIESPYNAQGVRRNNEDIVEYIIFIDSNKERQNVIDMLVEYAEASYDDDWDRMPYEENGTMKMPPSVVSIGKTSGLRYLGKRLYEVPEDEYRVDY